jgi:hypothetical protein
LAHIHQFSRNRCTTVSAPSPETLLAACTLTDTLTRARVEIVVKLPDLNIIEAAGEFTVSPFQNQPQPGPLLEKIIGVRVGPGMLKILKGLIGTEPERAELCYLVEECCEAVILSMTKGILAKAPRNPEEGDEFFSRMVRKNIRLYNQCAAFRPDSSLVKGMTPPGK